MSLRFQRSVSGRQSQFTWAIPARRLLAGAPLASPPGLPSRPSGCRDSSMARDYLASPINKYRIYKAKIRNTAAELFQLPFGMSPGVPVTRLELLDRPIFKMSLHGRSPFGSSNRAKRSNCLSHQIGAAEILVIQPHAFAHLYPRRKARAFCFDPRFRMCGMSKLSRCSLGMINLTSSSACCINVFAGTSREEFNSLHRHHLINISS